jgi:hypothetical protein
VGALGVQRVRGDDHLVQVEGVEQRGEPGDLAGLVVDHDLAEHGAGIVVDRRWRAGRCHRACGLHARFCRPPRPRGRPDRQGCAQQSRCSGPGRVHRHRSVSAPDGSWTRTVAAVPESRPRQPPRAAQRPIPRSRRAIGHGRSPRRSTPPGSSPTRWRPPRRARGSATPASRSSCPGSAATGSGICCVASWAQTAWIGEDAGAGMALFRRSRLA